jgi:hypothetical protein
MLLEAIYAVSFIGFFVAILLVGELICKIFGIE